MEYTILKLAKLAGVSKRTLRYYDEIGLLKPARINSSGYRLYGANEVNRLQQILFYRALDLDLETIRTMISEPDYDPLFSLREHQGHLLTKKNQIEQLLLTVEKTIQSLEGRITMSDQEKFEGFKQDLIDNNEKQYGREIREKYGNEMVDASYQKLKKMSKYEHEQLEKLNIELNVALKQAFESGDYTSKDAMHACALHQQWIKAYWPTYSKEAHLSLVQMYVDDERFTAYYDKIIPGCAIFLRDAMQIYLSS